MLQKLPQAMRLRQMETRNKQAADAVLKVLLLFLE